MANPYSFREIFEAMTIDLIHSLKRSFARHQKEELKEGFEWEQWQLTKLRSLQQYHMANKKIIDGYSQEIEDTIKEVLQNSFVKGQNKVQKAIEDSVLNFPTVDINLEMGEEHFFGVNDKKLEALQKTVINDFEKAQHAVLRKMDDVYRQTVFKAEVHLSSGTKTLDQAIDMVTKDFLEKGINCIEYKDGKRVNVASYAEMSLRTASQRATFLGEGKKRNEWGIYTVVVSAHATACDHCLPWQGKVLIDDVFSGGKPDGIHPLLSQAMKLNFLHPNCRHTLTTYFPGITQLPIVPKEEAIQKYYEAEQQQRYIERQIRRYKRLESGSVDSENQAKYSEKVKEWQGKLREHLDGNPQFRRKYSNEKPGPGISNKDIKTNAATLKQKAENGKIEEVRNKILNGEYNLTVRKQKQQEHILGTKQWKDYFKRKVEQGVKDRPTMFSKDIDIQKLVNEYKGKGTIEFSRSKDTYPREYINANNTLGKYWDGIEMKYKDSTRFVIIYSSKGTHAFPVRPLKKGE